MSTRVQIVVSPVDARAFTPYEALDVIKGTVPSSLRTWSKSGKCWVIDRMCLPILANALRQAGYTVFVTDSAGLPWTPPGVATGHRSTPAPDWVEQAFRDCPDERVEKLRRGLMTIWHPDLAEGNTALAQRINAAADKRLRKGAR